MNTKYLARISTLLEKHSLVLENHDIEFKSCFGAVAGYVRGRIFVSCGNFGIALKLPPDRIDRLLQQKGVKHLRYFSKGHIKKEYVVLPKRIIENKTRFKNLLRHSVQFALG